MNRKWLIITTAIILSLLTVFTILTVPVEAESHDYSMEQSNSEDVTWPTVSLTYGETLDEALLYGVADETRYSWVEPDTMPQVADSGITLYPMNYEADDGSVVSGHVTVTVMARSIDSTVITIDDEGLRYDGTAKSPRICIQYNNEILEEGIDYYVDCSKNINPTTQAVITVYGIGNFKDTYTGQFEIKKQIQDPPALPVIPVSGIGSDRVYFEHYSETGHVGSVSYGLMNDDGETTWYAQNQIQYLSPGTYTAFLKFSGNPYVEEAISEGVVLHLAPEEGKGFTIDYDNETVAPTEGYEISPNGVSGWQSSGYFQLEAGGTFYIRTISSDDNAISGISSHTIRERPTFYDSEYPTIDYYGENLVIPMLNEWYVWEITNSSGQTEVINPDRLEESISLANECFGWDGSSDVTIEYRIQYSDENKSYASETYSLTIPARPEYPSIPKIVERTDFYIIVSAEGNGTVQYRFDGREWSYENGCFDLIPSTTYKVEARIAPTDSSFASDAVMLNVTTMGTQNIPIVDGPESVSADTITMPYNEDWEYNLDNTGWTSGNVFTDLFPSSMYLVYVRIAGTDDLMPSESAMIEVWTVPETPDQGSGYYIEYYAEQIIANDGFQISSDGEIWSNYITAEPGSAFYIRAYFEYFDGDGSKFNVTSDVCENVAPARPGLGMETGTEDILVTDTTAVAPGIYGAEYKLGDSSVWDNTREFSDLTPGGQYQIHVRIAATPWSFAGETHTVSFTTKSTSNAPTFSDEGAGFENYIVAPIGEGLEYRISHSDSWVTDNTFTGLNPDTEYTVYIRKAATDTAPASDLTAVVIWTIPVAPATGEGFYYDWSRNYVIADYGYAVSVESGHWAGYGYGYEVEPGQTFNVVAVGGSQIFSSITENTAPQRGETAETDAMEVVLKTEYGFELKPVPGMEFTISGYDYWTENPFFYGLAEGTEYTVYMRSMGSDGLFPGEPVSITITTKTVSSVPVVEEAESVTDTMVVLPLNNGWEYSMDAVSWTVNNVFIDLDPATEYWFYIRVAETDDTVSYGYASVLASTSNATPVEGEGYAIYYDIEKLFVYGGYEIKIAEGNWLEEGEYEISPGDTFQIRAIGNQLLAASPAVTVTIDGRPTAPGVPEILEITDTQVVFDDTDGLEYRSGDGETTFFGGMLGGLSPETEYTISMRVPSTYESFASNWVNTIVETKGRPSVPVPNYEVTENSIKFTGAGLEFRINGENWTTDSVFLNLEPASEYEFYVRVAETKTSVASYEWYGTIWTANATPEVGEGFRIDFETETVWPEDYYEVRLVDSSVWVASPINIEPGNEIEVRRVNIFASDTAPPSQAIKNTIPDRPGVPTIKTEYVSGSTIVVSAVDGAYYSQDNLNWTESRVFSNLENETQYTIYAKIVGTSSSFESSVASIAVQTVASGVDAPSVGVPTSVTETTVTMPFNEAWEYNMDMTSWTHDNEFSGLNPASNHCVYVRQVTDVDGNPVYSDIAVVEFWTPCAPPTQGEGFLMDYQTEYATVIEGYEASLNGVSWVPEGFTIPVVPGALLYIRTVDASAPSSAIVTNTMPDRAAEPSVPMLSDRTSTTIIIDGVGMEYRLGIDGIWTSDPIFSGLQPGQPYTFFARIAATDSSYSSEVVEFQISTKFSAEKPTIGGATSVTDTTVTLPFDEAWEYSIDGETWYQDGEFTGLQPSTWYQFHVRVAETEDTDSSDSTTIVAWTAHAAPLVSTGYSINYQNETVSAKEGYEISTDGTEWKGYDGVLSLSPGSSFYVRVAEGDAPASTGTYNTLPVRPEAPTVRNFALGVSSGEPSITFSEPDFEFFIEGMWKDGYSIRIEGLEFGTQYTFPVRAEATLSSYSSLEGTVTLTTLAASTGVSLIEVVDNTSTVTVSEIGSEGVIIPDTGSTNIVLTQESIENINDVNASVSIQGIEGISVNYTSHTMETIGADTGELTFTITPSTSMYGDPGVSLSIIGSEGSISDLGSNAIISFPYTLREGENPNDLYIYCDDSGTRETIECEYSDGIIEFETNHHSSFYVSSDTTPSVDPGDNPDDESDNPGIIPSNPGDDTIIPPTIVIEEETSEDSNLEIIACVAASVAAALVALILVAELRRH